MRKGFKYADKDLTDGKLAAPINETEFGTTVTSSIVWTGTNPDGTYVTNPGPADCVGWTSASSTEGGWDGDPTVADSGWSLTYFNFCDGSSFGLGSLYCFQE